MRDYIAHGAGDHLLMPGDAARAISDVVEIVNRLWGTATPGGRLYPAPIQREIQLVGWSPREQVMAGPVGLPYDGQPLGPHEAVEQLRFAIPGRGPIDDWTWVLVCVVPHDDGLMRFDSLFEVTTYPCELGGGPGNAWDAVTWAEQELPKETRLMSLTACSWFNTTMDGCTFPDVLRLASAWQTPSGQAPGL